MVNRAGEDREVELRLPCWSIPDGGSFIWADLYHGQVMEEVFCNENEGMSWLATASLEAGGIGAVVMTEEPDRLGDLLATMAEMTTSPLSSFDHTWRHLQQALEDTRPDVFEERQFVPTSDTLLVPGGRLNFTVWGNAIECWDPMCPVDVQYPWESVPHRRHSSWVEVGHGMQALPPRLLTCTQTAT